MAGPPFPWLTAQPIAHRGLHGADPAPVENTLAAAQAALARGFAVECDLRLTRDGEAVVFHDRDLSRLTTATGPLALRTAEELAGLPFRRGTPGIPRLSTLLATVAGRVPLIVEIKSDFDGDRRLAARVAAVIAGYGGPLALKSFDVDVLADLRRLCVDRALGLVAEARFDAADWPEVPLERLDALRRVAGLRAVAPDFLSFAADDLPDARVAAFRAEGRPVMAWTIRNSAQRRHALRHADVVVFEDEGLL